MPNKNHPSLQQIKKAFQHLGTTTIYTCDNRLLKADEIAMYGVEVKEANTRYYFRFALKTCLVLDEQTGEGYEL